MTALAAATPVVNPAVRGVGSGLPFAVELAVLDDVVEQQRFTRWRESATGRREAESAFVLSGMTCAACADLIEQALAGVDGVLSAQVNAAGQRALVVWDPARTQASSLVLAIRGAGYDAVPDAAAPARELRRRERRQALWRLVVAAFCGMQVMMFATPSYVSTGSELAPDLRQLLNWGSWLVSLPVLFFSAGPFFRGAWNSLRARRIGMDVPVALGVAVTFVASSGATFDPSGPFGHEVFFDSFTMFISFLLLGRFLEMGARHSAAEQLEQTLAAMPETAQRLDAAGEVETVSVQRLRVGDRVRVPLGAAFPADGRLMSETRTEVDESLLTGESRPVPKQAGDELVGGSLNLGAPVMMQVERVGADTRFQAIVNMMRDALSQRPAMARRADVWAGPFLWAVLGLAAAAAAAWSVIDPARAVWVAVSVLIVTCPCALSLAVPSALVAATSALARRGVLLQRLDALEALADMNHLFMDKTGTLTEGLPQWVGSQALGGGPAEPGELAAAQALARWSSHPLSRALAEAADMSGADLSAAQSWSEVSESAGAGLEAMAPDGQRWRLGSLAWVGNGVAQASGTALPVSELACVHYGPVGHPQWRFDFDEQLRTDAGAAIRRLQSEGVEISLLSGDAQGRVERLSERLGLTQARGGALPEDKLAWLAQAQARGEVVGMVGDGINDAPVLARADVSLAMGQGALVARMQADAVILSNRLGDLAQARVLATKTMAVIRQNLVWAALYNAVCIPLAVLGYLPPWAAGLGMATSSLLVIGNSLRLSRPIKAEPTA